MSTLQSFLSALSGSANAAKSWFMAETIAKNRKDYFARGRLGDPGTGAVYAYFSEDGIPLYIGEACRPIKRRMHDQNSPHKNASWWELWDTVRLLPVADRTDRLTLELLLVLAFQPEFNVKPGKRKLSSMFQRDE